MLNLPEPVSIYYSDRVIFRVYRAKNQFDEIWPDESLKKTVLLCRSSYLAYGHRPLLDDYDSKAAIYLVAADYRINGADVVEWLSIRMVPGHGVLGGVLEPELYYIDKIRLDMYLKDNFFQGKDDFWRFMVSSSRMCGIKPQTISGNNMWPRNRFTAQAFALIHKQYVDDYPVSYDYITAIIGDDFILKVLGIKNNGGVAQPMFIPATELINMGEERIKLDRTIYAYKFPTYWFGASDLLKLIEGLVYSGHFTPKTLRHYFGIEHISLIGAEDLKIFSELFFSEGYIIGASITGSDLRRIAETKLKERPRLRITPAVKWNAAIGEMIRIGGLSKVVLNYEFC